MVPFGLLACSTEKKMKGDSRAGSSKFIHVCNTTSTSTSIRLVELGQHSIASPLILLMKRLDFAADEPWMGSISRRLPNLLLTSHRPDVGYTGCQWL